MDPVNGSGASCSLNQQSEPTSGSRSAIINSPPLASPNRVSDVDMRQILLGFKTPAGSPTSSTVRRFPGLELGHGMCDMRGLDLGAFESSYTYRLPGVETPVTDCLQESSQFLAQWAQLMPDEAMFEKYSNLDDLDPLLFDCSGVVELPKQPQFANSPASGTAENSETMSSPGPSVGDLRIRGDQIAATTSSGSVGTSTVRLPGKRKCPDGNQVAEDHHDGVPPSTLQEHSIPGTGPGKHVPCTDVLEESGRDTLAQQNLHRVRGSKRPDKSTRYAIETRSDVDIVDDGYRWRKYGQKPVKNSAHPRNYYRCTTPKCPVRKQVERCTDNPRNVLMTYSGIHNHPGNPRHGARESVPPVNAGEIAEEILTSSAPGTAPIGHHDVGLLGPRRLSVPSNYVHPNLLDQMLTSALFEPGRRPNPAPPVPGASVSQRNTDLLRMHQFFMMQYQSQYPLLSNMLNLMRNYTLAPPPFLDPLMLLAAENYGTRLRQDIPESSSRPPNSAFGPQAPRSTLLSRAQQRLLRIQELMGERLLGERKSQQASEPSTEHHEGVENLDLGDP